MLYTEEILVLVLVWASDEGEFSMDSNIPKVCAVEARLAPGCQPSPWGLSPTVLRDFTPPYLAVGTYITATRTRAAYADGRSLHAGAVKDSEHRWSLY